MFAKSQAFFTVPNSSSRFLQGRDPRWFFSVQGTYILKDPPQTPPRHLLKALHSCFSLFRTQEQLKAPSRKATWDDHFSFGINSFLRPTWDSSHFLQCPVVMGSSPRLLPGGPLRWSFSSGGLCIRQMQNTAPCIIAALWIVHSPLVEGPRN